MNRTAKLRLRSRVILVCLLNFLFIGLAAAQTGYQKPPPELAKLVDVPPTPSVSLSPDGTRILLMGRPSLPSIEEVAAPELRLAGIRINPRNTGPSRSSSINSLTFRTLGSQDDVAVTGLPENARIRNVQWSPDGRHVAFTLDLPDRIDLYVVDPDDGVAHRLIDDAVDNVYFGSPVDWLPDSQTLLVHAVPAGRGDPPAASYVPEGPIIQENIGKVAPARTYQDLLQNQHDADVFEYYMMAQLLRVGLDGSKVALGEPRMLASTTPSPSGAYVLVEEIHRPFSYLVPAYRFPQRVTVTDLDGNVVHEVVDLPLEEEVPVGFGSVATGMRSISWRADAPATLTWVEALDGGDARAEADLRDEVFMLDAPFSGDPVSVVKLPLRYGGIQWGNDHVALVNESWFSTRQRRTYVIDPSDPGAEPQLLFDVSTEDRYNDPGRPEMKQTENGTYVLMMGDDGHSIYLTGSGASPEGNRPFLRKEDLDTGDVHEYFRSEAPYYESPVTILDTDPMTVLTRRESVNEPPNYYVRNVDTGELAQVTAFPHPYPELKDVQKEFIKYQRADGVQLTATLYLPPGYDKDRDGPLPAFVWAYPVEFKSASAAGQVTDSPYRFKYVSYWGAVPYVTRGYAVLDDASMPIIGEGDAEPNDTFVEQLVSSARAAIDEGARRGVVDPDRVAIGGHSYGAFMTANLLAHSDLFRAGIARSGAYNRTLTPFGFQREERTYWEAPEIYYEMSPFMHADEVDEPLLMIHGVADNNSGTFPIQSERFYNALKGMGKTARLVMLPAEAHGYRAYESIMHMLWEMDRWLDTYVKNAGPRETEVEEASGDF